MRVLWHLMIALFLALCLVLTSSNPVAAQSPGDYFLFSYTVQFSKTQITGSELFNATVEAEATCKEDLPVSVSEASITGRIIAEHQESGARVTLNSSYTLTITPFPSNNGETTSTSQVVPLQFPQGSQSGTYSIIGELIDAEAKIGIFWIPVTAYLPSSQTVGSITYVAPVVTSGGGGGPPGAPTEVHISGLSASPSLRTNSSGIVQEACRLESLFMEVYLDIDKGTKLLDAQGNALKSILASEVTTPPEPPSGATLVSVVDFAPDGAKFEPGITLTMSYEPASLPEGMTEDELYIAYRQSSQWLALPSMVDTESNTVLAEITHFTHFALIGKLPPPPGVASPPPLPEAEPARFTISSLSITPGEVEPAQEVTVSAVVTNTGGSRGEYIVVLMVNGVVESTKPLFPDAGVRQKVSFSTVKDLAGKYEVDVNGLVGSFIVREAAVEPVAATPETSLLTPAVKRFNWWLTAGIAAAIIVLGIVVWQVVIRGKHS